MAKKICLLSDLHISINPRVWKEAFVYERAGYEVSVITQWVSDDLYKRDLDMLRGHAIHYIPFLDMRPGKLPSITRFFYRGRRRLAAECQKRLKISLPWIVGYAPSRLTDMAATEGADLYVGHTEAGIASGLQLHRKGRRVAFDLEDWHSEDYLVPERPVKLLRKLEFQALHEGLFFTVPSQAMADAIQEKYNYNRSIQVVYNSFPSHEMIGVPVAAKLADKDCFRMIWTSRTIGPGRGLETLLQVLGRLDYPVELHLLGNCPPDYREFLIKSWRSLRGHQLVFLDFIRHQDLLKTIAGYDLGLAIEESYLASRNTTITNKILQYLQAGLKVFATDTEGQKEVARCIPDAVYLVSSKDVGTWLKMLQTAILEREVHDRQKIMKAYEMYFSWSRQEEKLIALAEQVFVENRNFHTAAQ